jgi:hypothetical protein
LRQFPSVKHNFQPTARLSRNARIAVTRADSRGRHKRRLTQVLPIMPQQGRPFRGPKAGANRKANHSHMVDGREWNGRTRSRSLVSPLSASSDQESEQAAIVVKTLVLIIHSF